MTSAERVEKIADICATSVMVDVDLLCEVSDIARKALEENAELRERRDDLHNDRGDSLNACFRYQNQIKALRTEMDDALRQYSDRVDWLENRVNELRAALIEATEVGDE